MKRLLNNPFVRFVIWVVAIASGLIMFKNGIDTGFLIFFLTLICGSPLLITGYDENVPAKPVR